MPAAVFVIWWVTLIVAVVVVLPVVWYLLHRVLLTARNIEHYAADTLTAGVGIVQNTSAVPVLGQTIDVVGQILAGAGVIAGTTESIEQTLGPRTFKESP